MGKNLDKQAKEKRIKKAIADILWQARRYSEGRKTYAPTLFNDAYDVLREEFGDEIDSNIVEDVEGRRMYDVAIDHTSEHPYAFYGGMGTGINTELKNRKFYKKP